MARPVRSHQRRAVVPQRSADDFRRAWRAASRRIARRDRPILNALAAFDRGEYPRGRSGRIAS